MKSAALLHLHLLIIFGAVAVATAAVPTTKARQVVMAIFEFSAPPSIPADPASVEKAEALIRAHLQDDERLQLRQLRNTGLFEITVTARTSKAALQFADDILTGLRDKLKKAAPDHKFVLWEAPATPEAVAKARADARRKLQLLQDQ